MRGSQLGASIDAHDTVVRVNRIGHDTPEEAVDLGSRTDVLFSTLCNVKPEARLWVQLPGTWRDVSKAHMTCNLRTAEGCKFKTLALRGTTTNTTCGRHLQRLRGPPLAVPVAVEEARLVHEATTMVRMAAGMHSVEPSTGFHAMLTMAMHCKRLTVYGFDGDSSYDGHCITPEHRLDIEHMIMQQLVHGQIVGLPTGWRSGQLAFGQGPSTGTWQHRKDKSKRDVAARVKKQPPPCKRPAFEQDKEEAREHSRGQRNHEP